MVPRGFFELPFPKQPEKGEPEHLFRRDLLSCLDLRNLKVLVVDDNQTSRQVVTEMVRSFGFEVQAVDSGEKALKALADAADGAYQRVSATDEDVRQILRQVDRHFELSEDSSRPWVDGGYYFVGPVVLLFLLWFRKGWALRW